jgi:lysyl-tRNA synthetase class 2
MGLLVMICRLCNNKWDKAIKGLTKNNLAKVEKTDTSLFVSLV